MTLTDDQKAMLRVLAQREEGYEDMAALMGISVEELRRRVKEALSDVEDETDAAAPVEEPAPTVESNPPAPPAAEPPPEPIAVPASPPPASPPPPAKSSSKPRRGVSVPKLPQDRGARLGLGLGLLAVVAMAIVLIVGGGGGSSSSTSSAESETSKLIEAISRNPNLTDAILRPAPGGEGEGVAIFGRFGKAVVLEVAAKGLQPSESGESYAIWLSHSGKAMVPMGTSKATSSGEIGARLEVPATVLALVAGGGFNEVQVTRVTDSRLKAAVAVARKQKAESRYTGKPVLQGRIAGRLVRAGKKLSR